jgi:hypothetical protein
MGFRDALPDAMHVLRSHRPRRLGTREAERLLTGVPAGDSRRALAILLRSAAAPPSPGELTGEREALVAFRLAACRPTPVRPVPVRRRPPAALCRVFVLRAAAGAAVVLAGGVAVAAEAGKLPSPAQRSAHHLLAPLGVPPEPARTPAGTPGSVRAAGPASQTAPQPTGPRTTGPPQAELCRAYRRTESDKDGGRALDGSARRALAEAAGGAENIDAYCARLLGVTPPPSGGPASPTPSAGPDNRPMHSQPSADPSALPSADPSGGHR